MEEELRKWALEKCYSHDDLTLKVPTRSLMYGDYTMKPKEEPMSKLYEITATGRVVYGHKLATNSQGQWVMEAKGTGEVFAVDKAYVQEVLPHTIGVQFETGKSTYHYLADAGKYQTGSFYLMDAPNGRAIVQIVSVDTKHASSTKHFTPLAKLLVE